MNGWLIDLATGARVGTAERLHALAERLLPSAAALGCDRELLGIGRIVLEGGGSAQQRRAFETGDPGDLILSLASETHPSLGETGAAALLRDPEPSALRSA